MAIRLPSFTEQRTGATLANAVIVFGDVTVEGSGERVVVPVKIYADAAQLTNGKAPISETTHVLTGAAARAVTAALRDALFDQLKASRYAAAEKIAGR